MPSPALYFIIKKETVNWSDKTNIVPDVALTDLVNDHTAKFLFEFLCKERVADLKNPSEYLIKTLADNENSDYKLLPFEDKEEKDPFLAILTDKGSCWERFGDYNTITLDTRKPAGDTIDIVGFELSFKSGQTLTDIYNLLKTATDDETLKDSLGRRTDTLRTFALPSKAPIAELVVDWGNYSTPELLDRIYEKIKAKKTFETERLEFAKTLIESEKKQTTNVYDKLQNLWLYFHHQLFSSATNAPAQALARISDSIARTFSSPKQGASKTALLGHFKYETECQKLFKSYIDELQLQQELNNTKVLSVPGSDI